MLNKEKERRKIRILILHHPDDQYFKARMSNHLSALTIKSIADIWDEDTIHAGAEREKEIQYQIQNAGIVLFLISASSMASKSLNEQLNMVIYRHKQESLHLIPIRVRYFYLKKSDLEQYQILPRNGKSLDDSSWNSPDEPYAEISREVAKIAHALNSGESETKQSSEFEDTKHQFAFSDYFSQQKSDIPHESYNKEIIKISNTLLAKAQDIKQNPVLFGSYIYLTTELNEINSLKEMISGQLNLGNKHHTFNNYMEEAAKIIIDLLMRLSHEKHDGFGKRLYELSNALQAAGNILR